MYDNSSPISTKEVVGVFAIISPCNFKEFTKIENRRSLERESEFADKTMRCSVSFLYSFWPCLWCLFLMRKAGRICHPSA
ncbi:MAG: hypothetical protein A2428_03820 [Bdellovibrionales bacterium RIFOXYC1_FULL_54_43]|nr:MAG: hypothetical protein A2428_03820 [Bdellovibrionales bacterium RIFOXYC1_FULL_54_43]